jgi:hypothetical protein
VGSAGIRGISLVHLARVPDAYLWIHAYCLEALAEAAIDAGRSQARDWVTALGTVPARTGMAEMLVRAQLLLARLGDQAAREAASLFSDRVDNPIVLARSGALVTARGTS